MITKIDLGLRNNKYGPPQNTLLKLWVDGVGQIKAKERLVADNSERVVDMNIQHFFDGYVHPDERGVNEIEQRNSTWFLNLSYAEPAAGGEVQKTVEVTDYTSPTFIYTADGETETVEPVTFTPTWLPPKPPIDEFKAKLRKTICDTAQHLNDANVHERAHRKVKVSELCLDIQNPDLIKDTAERAIVQGVIDEVDNTVNHFRAWVGAAWKHVDDLDAAATDAQRLNAVEFVLTLQSELGHVDEVGRFQDRHASSAWKRLLATRQLYRTRDGMVSGKLEIKPGDAFGGVYTKADWERLLLHYYNEAHEHCHDLPPEVDPFA